MRTTLDIEDSLLIRARTEAAKTGRTLTSIMEDALRSLFGPRKRARKAPKFVWHVENGTKLPPVDIANRNALYDFLDRNS